MGQKQKYDCPRCGYGAYVSGGMGFGLEAMFVTIHCHDCGELHDALADPRSDAVADELADELADKPAAAPADPSPDALTPGLACPRNQTHRFDLWEAGGPCPGCGATMIKGRSGPCPD